MAGDWIKMREQLYTHPKLIGLTKTLIYDESLAIGLLKYCIPEQEITFNTLPSKGESVTDNLLRCVTERALRGVTLSVTLHIWCVVNAHCKMRENDAVLQPFGLAELDEIAGMDGFGEAMERVGWVIVDRDDNSLIFPNFHEHNSPAQTRSKAMSSAERQRLYRERKKANSECVTERYESNGREEKRREEKKTQTQGRFPAPSVREVQDYLDKQGIESFTGEDFVNHYAANGWMRGKNKIKSWKHCVGTWVRAREKDTPKYGEGAI